MCCYDCDLLSILITPLFVGVQGSLVICNLQVGSSIVANMKILKFLFNLQGPFWTI